MESVTLRHSVQDVVLKVIPDFFRLAKRLQQGKGTLQVSMNLLNIIIIIFWTGLCQYLPITSSTTHSY